MKKYAIAYYNTNWLDMDVFIIEADSKEEVVIEATKQVQGILNNNDIDIVELSKLNYDDMKEFMLSNDVMINVVEVL